MQAIPNTDNSMKIGATEAKTKKGSPAAEEFMGFFANIWSKHANMHMTTPDGEAAMPVPGDVAEDPTDKAVKTHAGGTVLGMPFMIMTEVKDILTAGTMPKGQGDIKIDSGAIRAISNDMPKPDGQRNPGNEAVIKESGLLHNYAVNRKAGVNGTEVKSEAATPKPSLEGMVAGKAERVVGPEQGGEKPLADVAGMTTGMKSGPIHGKPESVAGQASMAIKPEEGIRMSDGANPGTESTRTEAEKAVAFPVEGTEGGLKGMTNRFNQDMDSFPKENPEQKTGGYPTEENLKNEKTQTVDKSFADKAVIPPDAPSIDPESIKPDATEKINDVEVVKQVIDKVSLQKLDQGEILRVRLKPDSLGSITIRLERGVSGLTATISTNNSEVQRALAGGLEQLATALSENGTGRNVIDVVLEENYFDGQGANGFMFEDRNPDSGAYGGTTGRHVPVEQEETGTQEQEGKYGRSMIDIYG